MELTPDCSVMKDDYCLVFLLNDDLAPTEGEEANK